MGKVKIKWSPEFSYAIGLLVTDGSLSINGRSINFTSKDIEMINNIQKCLGVNFKISKKGNGMSKEKRYFYIQIGDINFYRFLLNIGLMANKTKIVKEVKIPKKYFFDFLRGHFDGDGSFYSYWDPRWKSSHMFYVSLISASKNHMIWLQDKNLKYSKVKGHLNKSGSIYQLRYAKAESLKLLSKMYYDDNVVCLSRKREKIKEAISIENKHNKEV